VRISTKKQASNPSASGSRIAVVRVITPCSRIRRIRFQTGVFEDPTFRAISSSDCSASRLQFRQDFPVQVVQRGAHS
jgi:hypothetical protein